MKKYYLNINVQTNVIKWIIFEEVTGTYKCLINKSISTVKKVNLLEWIQRIQASLKSLPSSSIIYTNIIFDDNQFSDLQLITFDKQVKLAAKLQVDYEIKNELNNQINHFFVQNNNLNPLSLQCIEYLTISNNIAKHYKQFPYLKTADVITAKNSCFSIANSHSYNALKKLFISNFPNVEFFIRSQTMANHLFKNDGFNLLVDTNEYFTTLNLVKNGVIIKHKILSVGTEKIYNIIAKQTNLKIDEIKVRIDYLFKNNFKSNNDEHVVVASQCLKKFAKFLEYQINQFVNLNTSKTHFSLNSLVFGGSYAQLFKAEIQPKNFKVDILDQIKSSSIFKIDDLAHLGAINLIKQKHQENDKDINTLDSQIIFTKKPILQKLKHAFITSLSRN